MGEKEGGDTLIFGRSWPLACDSAPLPTCTVYMELSLPILDLIFFREAKPNLHHAERSWRICRHVHPQVNINMLWTRRKCEFTTCDVLILLTSYCTGTDFILWHVICRKCSDSNRILSARDHASIQVFFAINCELLVFSWLMATYVVWQMKSHRRQFTLVKHCVCTVATWVPIWGTWSPWGPYSVFGSPFLFQGPHFLYLSSWTCEKSMQSLSNVDN